MSKKNVRRAGAAVLILLVAAIVAVGWGVSGAASTDQNVPPQSAWPRTRAEVTNYTVTSSYADVVTFIDSLKKLGARINTGSIGRTAQGRELPYIIASRPLVATPAEARALGRPVVYVQGNIHSGEVEGKEALLAKVRDLVFSTTPNVLDSVVLIAVPIYNADGNENLGPQARNRGSQNGPELVGTRPNSEGNNLNRDYIKAASPESRGSLGMFNQWDPHVFVDLHTSNGSMHGYGITYSPPLNPAALHTYPFTRDSLLPRIRRGMRENHGFETFDYGNWSGNCGDNCSWGTYDHTPRYGTNYYGLRGRIAILSEAFSHDPFEKRVRATYAFVQEILSVTAAHAASVLAITAKADADVVAWGRNPAAAPEIPVRSRLTATGFRGPILVAEVETIPGDTTRYEAGLRPGQRKTGRVEPREMTIRDRFDPVLTRRMPYGYALSPSLPAEIRDRALALLRLHGIQVGELAQAWSGDTEVFRVEDHRNGTFENFATTSITGSWRSERRTLPAGSWVVSTAQPLGILAVYMMEAETDDGLVSYTMLDPVLTAGSDFPILRMLHPLGQTR